MANIVLIVIGVLVVLIAGLLAYAATRPDTFRVERSAKIKASPDRIFPLINDYHNWTSWSPYEKLDPAMKRTYSGPASGKGAVYAWEGNGKVGQGRMETTDTAPSAKVTIQLDFLKPFEAHHVAEFTLEPNGDSTRVTWAMQGRCAFFAKLMHLCFNMDRMIGGQFAEGLENMKAVAEK